MKLSNILKSKTMWMGFVVAVIPLLQFVQSLPLSAQTASIISSVLGVLVMVNRYLGDHPELK